MTTQEEKAFVKQAFQKLKERGWFSKTGLVPTGVTDGEIAAFEAKYQIRLPSLYKAFLQAYEMEYGATSSLWGIADDDGFCPCPISLNTMTNTMTGCILVSVMDEFRKCATDIFSYSAGPEQYGKYLPIGNWDSDWLLWDLSKPLDQVDAEDERTWTLVSFAHDEEWDERYWAEGGFARCPDFKTLLEWYFYGSLISEFEEENCVKVTYERLNDYDFLWHWYEDRWKER